VGDRKDFNNPDSGDAHLWSVWHGRLPFEWYRTCTHRFNSEFGFQSFPEAVTVKAYTAPQDRNVTTAVMEHHQKSGIGNTVIMQYLLDWFRLPGDFPMTLRLSQILQGMAMKYAVEHWRRAMPRGMGTLYWQINDCWPVASWSSIDYFGRWKALHYMARDFNAPLLVSGFEDAAKGTVEVHVTSDLMEATRAEVAWSVTDVSGALLEEVKMPLEAPARTNRLVTTLALSRHIQARGARGLLVWLELRQAGVSVSSNLVLFSRPKHLELLEPSLSVQVAEAGADKQTFDVTLACRSPALWVWLELEGIEARFSKNYFHAMPGRPVTVRVTTAAPATRAALESTLRACSLRDTYV
jgi:beta-mannosidase